MRQSALIALLALGICSSPAQGQEPAPASEQKVFEPKAFEKLQCSIKEKCLPCRSIKLDRYVDKTLETLLQDFNATGLPLLGADACYNYKHYGVFHPFFLARAVAEHKSGKKPTFQHSPDGLTPDIASLLEIDRAVVAFSSSVATPDGNIAGSTGTAVLFNSSGMALTAFHNIEPLLFHAPNLTAAEKKTIIEGGLDPKKYPEGLSFPLSYAKSGNLSNGGLSLRAGSEAVLKILVTPAFGPQSNPNQTSLSNAAFDQNEPDGAATLNRSRFSLEPKSRAKDWAIVQFSPVTPATSNVFLKLRLQNLQPSGLEKAQLFSVSYPGQLFSFPTSLRQNYVLPFVGLCWTDDEVMTKGNQEYAPGSGQKMAVLSGIAGSGQSGAPLISNIDREVYGVVNSIGFTKAGLGYDIANEPPPFQMRFYPVPEIESELIARGMSLKNFTRK